MKHKLMKTAVSVIGAVLLSGCTPVHEAGHEHAAADEGHEKKHTASEVVTNVETTDLGNGVYMLSTGRGGNMALAVGPDSALLVDDEFAKSSPAILAAIKAITDKPVKYLINTHYHGDHTGGNEIIANKGVVILAHHNVHKRMSAPQKSDVELFSSKPTPASAVAARPHITYGDGTKFHMEGQRVLVTYMANAHTDGDSHVFFQDANVLHMGDTFFNGAFAYIDTQAGGSLRGMIAAQDFVLANANPDVVIIPGHGKLANLDDLAKTTAMLKEVYNRIKVHFDAGKSLDEIKSFDPLIGLEEFVSFVSKDAMVEIAYHSMRRSAER